MRDEEYRAMFELEERLWWYQGMRAITATLLGASLGATNRRLLDIGCGTGYSAVWLRERFNFQEVYGVDLSTQASLFWKTRGLDTCALASADRLPVGGAECVL